MADSKLSFDENRHFYSKTEEEIASILEGRSAKNMKRATKSNIKTFHDYLHEKSMPNLDDLDMNELPVILENFYPNLQRVNGEDYKLQSLKCIRAGINRWTKENRNIDIISDVHFTKANEIFKGVSKIAHQTAKASTKSYPTIVHEDLERLANYFLHDIMNAPDPRRVQRYVLFYIIYFFC